MKKNLVKSTLIIAAAFPLVIGAAASAMGGWSSSGGSWSGGSWSGASSQKPTCVASDMTLNLTIADCIKCHPGVNSGSLTFHHNLIKTQNKPCLSCHQFDASNQLIIPVQRDCVVCHQSSVHNTVTHCVVDTCGGCHSGSLPQIHSDDGRSSRSGSYHGGSYGAGSDGGSLSSCYLCHTSTSTRVKQAIVKGLSGQTVSCSDCHGGGR